MKPAALPAIILIACAWTKSAGDTVRFVPDAADAWRTRLEMIRAARTSIDVAVFIWRDDRTGLEMAGLLQEAARRGVRVRIIADGLARSLPGKVTAALAGTERLFIHDYHPPLFYRPEWLNRRLHDKLIIVDGRQVLIGGRNFTDRYFDRGGAWNYIDLDVLITGDHAAHAQAYFDELWESGEIRDVKLPPLIKPLNGGRFNARTGRHAEDDRRDGRSLIASAMASPSGVGRGDRRAASVVSASRLEFVHEEVPRTPDQSRCVSRIEQLLGAARREVWISTPWLVTTARTRALLLACLDRGVKIHIVTNSLNACRDYIVFAAHMRTCADLAAEGVVIHWLPGPGSLHSKTVVIDESTAVAGTLNFDPRSEFWNTESMVVIKDGKTARELLDVIRHQARDSYLLDANKPFIIGTTNPSLTVRMKKAFLPVMKLFSPLIRSWL